MMWIRFISLCEYDVLKLVMVKMFREMKFSGSATPLYLITKCN